MVSADLARVGDRRHVFYERAQPVFGLLEEPLRLLFLRDVLRDLRETPQIALIVVQRRRYSAGQEPGSILAHEPVLFSRVAFPSCSLEMSLRPAPLCVFFGEEYGVVLACDLLGRVAFKAFGARVPACYAPLWVEHEDCVIPRAFHQRAEVFLALAQPVLALEFATLRPRPRRAAPRQARRRASLPPRTRGVVLIIRRTPRRSPSGGGRSS